MSVKVFLEEISIWVSRLSKGHPDRWGWASSNPVKAWVEQKGRGRKNSFLSQDIPFLLPSDTGAPGSQSFDSYLHLDHQSPGSQAFRLRLNFTTAFSDSPACRLQMADCGASQPPWLQKPVPIINLFSLSRSLSLYIYPISLWISMSISTLFL